MFICMKFRQPKSETSNKYFNNHIVTECSSPNCSCVCPRPDDASYSNASRSSRHDDAGTGPPTALPHPPAPAGARPGSGVCPATRPTSLLHTVRCNAGMSGHTPPVAAPHLPALSAVLSNHDKLLHQSVRSGLGRPKDAHGGRPRDGAHQSAFALSPVTTRSASSCLQKSNMIKPDSISVLQMRTVYLLLTFA